MRERLRNESASQIERDLRPGPSASRAFARQGLGVVTGWLDLDFATGEPIRREGYA